MRTENRPEDSASLLRRFLEFCRRRDLPRAVLRDIPGMGNTLEALAFEPERSHLTAVLLDDLQKHQEAREAVEALMRRYTKGVKSVLTIGSGVSENLLVVKGELLLGSKHVVEAKHLFGGSGVNYTLRLNSTGVPVLPVLSMGHDRAGRAIQEFLTNETREKVGIEPYISYIADDDFLCRELVTSTSTIIVDGDSRTVFTENLQGAKNFEKFASSRIEVAEDVAGPDLSAVMVGHILSDSPVVNAASPAGLTKSILTRFGGRVKVFANLGNSQLALGSGLWDDYLHHIDILQFSLSEVRTFFRDNKDITSLQQMLQWFRQRNVTTVITLDRLGAIATFKDGSDGLIFGWPFELETVVDSTGAGDAFGAGLVSAYIHESEPRFGHFLEAIKRARVWAAYACGSHGGASETPDLEALRRFEASLTQLESVQSKSATQSELLLKLLDKAYPMRR